MDIIIKKLDKMEQRLTSIEEKLEATQAGSERMVSHIDFVENVYSTLKSPLNYLSWKFGFAEQNSLPQVKSIKKD